MMDKFTNLETLKQFAVDYIGDSEEFECDINLYVGGDICAEYHAHTVSVCNRDLLFYCDDACLNYVIDSYGDSHAMELVNVEY